MSPPSHRSVRMHPARSTLAIFALALLGAGLAGAAAWASRVREAPVDEAMAAGKTVADFPQSDHDYFPGLDGNVQLGPDELRGRNTWMLWTAGDEAFWDYRAQHSYGLTDLLKTIDSRRRGTRHRDMGLVSAPDTRKAERPDEFGLWIDEPASPDGYQPNPAVYGRSSGVVGLRLFPNPKFDDAARA